MTRFGKDISFGKVFKTTGWQLRMLLSVEVHVKPMRSFDLKTQSNDILSFFFRDVDQKSTKAENNERNRDHR